MNGKAWTVTDRRGREQANEMLGLTTTAAFAAGCVLTQVVTVPTWRMVAPDVAHAVFRRSGPATGALLFPLEVASTVIVSRLALSSRRRGDKSARSWMGAASALTLTFVTLATYFARANTRLLNPALPPADVEVELRRWQRWNMARTALAVGALAAAGNAARHTLPR